MTAPYSVLNDAAAEVREYAGSATSNSVLRLLAILEADYKAQLVDVKPEGLVERQTAVRQVQALQKLLRGDPHTDGRI